MPMIRLLLIPIFKKYRKLIAAMIAVSSLGIAMMTGMNGAYQTLKKSLDAYVVDYRYADAVITTGLTDTLWKDQLLSLPGVRQVNHRIAADFQIKTPQNRPVTVRGFSYGIRDFQMFFIWEEKESTDYPNVALDYKFAKKNGISAGDLLEVKLGDSCETVCVGQIVSSVECLAMIQDTYSWGENSDFGYAFVPEELLYDTEYYNQCNQFLLRFDDWADPETILTHAETLLAPAEIISSFLYRDSAVFRKIDANIMVQKTLAVILPTLFFVCMIAVLTLFLSQMIQQSRKDIGILRALGFSQVKIRLLFCAITLVFTLIASALGIGIGYCLMTQMNRIYQDFFPLPHLYTMVNHRITAAAVALTVAVGQVSTMISSRMISNIQPSEAMTREAPGEVKTPLPVRRFLSGASPAVKFSITSMLRNQRRFLFSAVCVAFSIVLILSAVAFNESKNGILTRMYIERTHYDAQIFFTEEPSQELIDSLNASGYAFCCQAQQYFRPEITTALGSETISICALDSETDLITVFGLHDDPLVIPESGIVLEKHTAYKLGIAVGDTISVGKSLLTVAALSDQSVGRMSYVSVNQAKSLGQPDRYCILARCTNEQQLLERLCDEEGYSYINFTSALRAGSEETFAIYTLGVEILIGFAMMLGMIIVFNTIQTNLLEQKKGLSVMRAIGFQISDISRIWLLQSGLQFLLSCLLGLPVGTWIARYALGSLTTAEREYPFSRSPVQYLITVGLVLLYILLSHWAAMNSIRKWDIAENTKEKE